MKVIRAILEIRIKRPQIGGKGTSGRKLCVNSTIESSRLPGASTSGVPLAKSTYLAL